MKQIFRAFAIFPILMLLSATAFSQQLKKAKTLSPEDLGIQKYIFQCTPKKGFVVIFRIDEYADARLVSSFEVVTNGLDTQTLLLIDSQKLKNLVDGTPGLGYPPSGTRVSYVFLMAGGSEVIRGFNLREWPSNNPKKPKLKFVFENPKTHLAKTFIYTMTSERYEDVEKQYHQKLQVGS